jgi:hypothetical protein
MIIKAVADLHGCRPDVPAGGSVFVIAGDCTSTNERPEWFDFWLWVYQIQQKYSTVLVTGGNHDSFMQKGGGYEMVPVGVHYLVDEPYFVSTSAEKTVCFYMSPWTLWFKGINPDCMAYTCKTEEELDAKFAEIPDFVDILVTHGPPHGILDENSRGQNCGSKALLKHVQRVKPAHHIFGHIHEQGATETTIDGTTYHNVAFVDTRNFQANDIQRIKFERPKQPINYYKF